MRASACLVASLVGLSACDAPPSEAAGVDATVDTTPDAAPWVDVEVAIRPVGAPAMARLTIAFLSEHEPCCTPTTAWPWSEECRSYQDTPVCRRGCGGCYTSFRVVRGAEVLVPATSIDRTYPDTDVWPVPGLLDAPGASLILEGCGAPVTIPLPSTVPAPPTPLAPVVVDDAVRVSWVPSNDSGTLVIAARGFSALTCMVPSERSWQYYPRDEPGPVVLVSSDVTAMSIPTGGAMIRAEASVTVPLPP